MDDILVLINKQLNIVTIFHDGKKLIKSTNEYDKLSEEEIKIKYLKELNIN